MNDFTKEELTIILLSISGIQYKSLKDKIQSMIDNYCAHSPIIIIRNDGTIIQCYKCGKEYTGD